MASYLEKLFNTNRIKNYPAGIEPYGDRFWYPFTNGGLGDIDQKNYLAYFITIPELNGIINLRARSLTNWKLEVVSTKTGLPATNMESLVKILRNPNSFQAESEFWQQSSLYRDIYANEYLYFLTPIGMANTYKGMFTLDPMYMKVSYNKETPYFQSIGVDGLKYSFEYNNKAIPIEKDSIIHLSDNNVVRGNIMQGESKIKTLHKPLENIRLAYEKRRIALKTSIGIFSNSDTDSINQGLPIDETEREDVKKRLKMVGAEAIITNLKTKYNAINVNAKNLGLFEEITEDVKRIADMYGVPLDLTTIGTSTYENQTTAERRFYTNTIIPEAQERIDALNLKLGTEKKSWEIRATYDHLPIFAEDIGTRATTLNTLTTALGAALTAGAITVEQYQEELKKFNIG